MNAQIKFNAAVNVIKSLPKDGPYQPSHDMMLKFYGLYKQATEGPCEEQKPAFYELVKGYKWKAWSALGLMSKEDAMTSYVDELKKIVETMSFSDDVASFVDAVAPFYEYVDIIVGKNDSNHNIPKNSKNGYNNEESFSHYNGHYDGRNNRDDSSTSDNEEGGYEARSLTSNGYHAEGQQDTSEAVYSNAIKIDSDCSEGILVTKSNSKKLASDTDTEDEYSEPAETPELLQQKRHRIETNAVVEETTSRVEMNGDEIYLSNEQPISCGGGDANVAGRLTFNKEQGSDVRGGQSLGASGSSSMMPTPVSQRGVGGGSTGGRRRRDSDRSDRRYGGGGPGVTGSEVNAQLVLILQKIHQDLQAVVVRLDSLETQAYNEHADRCSLCQRRSGNACSSQQRSWWPFPELSPRSTFFLLTWPLILHGATKLLLFLRSRRRRRLAAN